MTLKMYSIRDAKSESFNPPFFQPTHGVAERAFKELVNDPKSNANKYPEDYDLYYLGEYDDNTGKLAAKDTPEHMVKAVNVKETSQQLN